MGLRLKADQRHAVVYEDGDTVVKFFVRVLPEGKVRRLLTKNVALNRDNIQEPNFNIGGLVDDKVDSIIMDWEGVEDSQGNPLPCNRSNKLIFYDNYPEIVDYVLAEVDKIAEREQKEKEKDLKNLRSGPGGPRSQD